MAEETDQSRTEPASARRLQEARRAGDVPRSAELSSWLVLLAALAVLVWGAPRLFEALQVLTVAAFSQAALPLSARLVDAAHGVLWAILPLLVAIFIAALVAPMALSGWVYAPEAARVDLARVHPAKPFARMFSLDAWFDGSLALLKLALAAAAAGWALASGWSELHDLSGSDLRTVVGDTSAWVGRGVLALAAALAVAAALDAGWRWWRYLRRHAMTWQEVLAEAREAEVHPEIRAQLRGRQQQAAQRGAQSGAGPLPQAGEGASAGPKAIDEVIG